jgi:hypothetical protein
MSVPVATTATIRWIDRRWFIRALEIFPGGVTWFVLLAPIILSLFVPVWVAYFIIAFDLYWMVKSFRLSMNLIRGYRKLHQSQRVDWVERLNWLRDPHKYLAHNELAIKELAQRHPEVLSAIWWRDTPARKRYRLLKEEQGGLAQLAAHERVILPPDEIYHVVMLATFNESLDILEPSVRSLTEVDYALNRIILVLAYEERGGAADRRQCSQHSSSAMVSSLLWLWR